MKNEVLALGKLASQFATIQRVTFLADGVTPESDTDHTVMLGLIACAVAHKHDPGLDVGLVAQFALVHDLVEAYVGDTNTFGGLSPEEALNKAAREEQALKQIRTQFTTTLPWVPETIEKYESLETKEARFVKIMDKVLPSVTMCLNANFTDFEKGFDAHVAMIYGKYSTLFGEEQAIALSLYKILADDLSAKIAIDSEAKPEVL